VTTEDGELTLEAAMQELDLTAKKPLNEALFFRANAFEVSWACP